MKTNLLLFAVILVGGWYLFNLQPPPPVAVPAPQPVARVNRADRPTYNSPLNDGAVSVGSNHGSRSGYPGNNQHRSSSLTLDTGNPVRGGASMQPSSVTGLRADGLSTGNGESTLDLQRRADAIGNAAKGE